MASDSAASTAFSSGASSVNALERMSSEDDTLPGVEVRVRVRVMSSEDDTLHGVESVCNAILAVC